MALNSLILIRLFNTAIAELQEGLSSSENFAGLMSRLGWNMDVIPQLLTTINSDITILEGIYEDIKNNNYSLETIEEAYDGIKTILDDIEDIKNQASYFTTNFPDFEAENYSQLIYKELPDYLICKALIKEDISVYNFFILFGLISEELILESSLVRCPYTKYVINYYKFEKLLSSPIELIYDNYDWGNNNFKFDKFISHLQYFLRNIGVPIKRRYVSEELANKIENGVLREHYPDRYAYNIGIIDWFSHVANANASISLDIHYLPGDSNVTAGFALVPLLKGNFSDSSYSETADLYVNIRSSLKVENGLGLLIRPENIEILNNIFNDLSSNPIEGNITISLIRMPSDEESYIYLIGDDDSTHLRISSASISIGAKKESNQDPDFFVELAISNLTIHIDQPDDGFLKRVIPSEGLNFSFDTTLGFSQKRGLYFGMGGSGLDIKIPISASFGSDKFGIKISEGYLSLKTDDSSKLILQASASFELAVGKTLLVSVKKTGIKSSLAFVGNGGNLGPLDSSTTFKPPSGLGISIKSSTVNGGGFLEFEPDNYRYLGALELKIKKITLGVIGILKTKLPGGKDGYSLLMIVTVEGFSPIALGFGFSLTGIGGLLGLNRTANVDALRSGLKTGANQSILFPKDIIKNIDKIVSDLETCFPDKEGRFLVGPMAKIIWGTPKALITIDLGLIIEIPDPITLIILGVVKAILPDENTKKLIININFLGTIEFEKKLIAFDASIYDSKILTFDVNGDMAFRLKWGEQSNFLLSVGGFHPAYTPPPLSLPTLNRLAITLVNTNKLKVGLQTYFAITSNTVQFGARVSAYAEHGKYNARGEMWLDVLFQFSPFYFIADVGAMVAIRRGDKELLSASLRATLQGPSPWSVRGSAEFTIAGISASVKFNEEWGEKDAKKVEDKDVWPELLESVKHKDNWSTLIPERNQLFVNVKEREAATADTLRMHPLGRLAMSQTTTPFNFGLQKFGHVKPKDYSKFKIDAIKTAAGTPIAFNVIKDKFSPAKYIEMSDDQKLSRPSFEDMDSGISIGTDNLVTSHKILKDLAYQSPRVIDRRMKTTLVGTFNEDVAFANAALQNATVFKSLQNPKRNELPTDGPVSGTINPRKFAVANKSNINAYDSARFDSVAQASAYVDEVVRNNPNLKNKLMVAHELELV